MIENFKTKPNGHFEKNPWLGQTTESEACDIHDDWLTGHSAEGRMYFFDLGRLSPGPVAVLVDEPNDQLTVVFTELTRQWKEETWFNSSIKRRISHPAFLKIIGMGAAAVPLILEELRREPDYWSYALEAITRQDPAPEARSLGELRDAWLAWGEAHGY